MSASSTKIDTNENSNWLIDAFDDIFRCHFLTRGSCRIADRETESKYFCKREDGHSGPCAAVPNTGL